MRWRATFQPPAWLDYGVAHAPKDELTDLMALANTRHGPGAHYRIRAKPTDPAHDHLAEPSDALDFLRGHAVEVPERNPTPRYLAELRTLREVARAVVDGGPGPRDPAIAALVARARYRMSAEGQVRPVSSGWRGVTEAMLPGLFELDRLRERVRVCANPACRWLFVDRTAGGVRRWCEMAVCGNRVKGQRFRHRLASAPATGRSTAN
jgi:predicted RNA-binding Zn ribbon-like protein